MVHVQLILTLYSCTVVQLYNYMHRRPLPVCTYTHTQDPDLI